MSATNLARFVLPTAVALFALAVGWNQSRRPIHIAAILLVTASGLSLALLVQRNWASYAWSGATLFGVAAIVAIAFILTLAVLARLARNGSGTGTRATAAGLMVCSGLFQLVSTLWLFANTGQ